ncbi:MAG TPA: NAD-dependent epimerase/dehydratase family protein [Gaiellaceae bacterium]|nr:NAD-dependent epimerase/dehydratase family protein [Gaiellaceae bacterium]
MRILVLGGTQFLGRHVVEHALARGHEVTLFNRGRTRPDLFPAVERLRGDRDGDLASLAGRDFDAVVDTSGYVPRVVAATLDALGEVGHYTFVSSVSAYADLSLPPTEASPVAELDAPTEDWRSEAYGALKAACEAVVRERFPRAFVVRPGLIVGPFDPTGRFTYWPLRLAAGGRVLAPAPPAAPAQVIDARDLAAWIVQGAESGLAGTFNAVDRPTTRAELLDACRRAAAADAELAWVDPAFLVEQGVGEWMELPLWLHDPAYAGMLSVDATRAFAAGLRTRPLEETARDTLVWALAEDAPGGSAGLDREKERRVLAAWDARPRRP